MSNGQGMVMNGNAKSEAGAEREIVLGLSESEYTTLMVALFDYANSCLSASVELAGVGSRFKGGADPLGGDPMEGARLEKLRCDRAFDLQTRIRNLWEV